MDTQHGKQANNLWQYISSTEPGHGVHNGSTFSNAVQSLCKSKTTIVMCIQSSCMVGIGRTDRRRQTRQGCIQE